ncbi:polysaccharide deacetylase family protein, partial [Mycobacterium tuberculosis]|nr:polysaccharide deacetylase family protein [Mycobacterium tuberculosis]
LDAHYGLKSLPPKAFLLSFDDAYSSFYTRVWPLLKAWNVPALWAPVGSWVDTPAGQPVNFGGLMTPRERFATWEMAVPTTPPPPPPQSPASASGPPTPGRHRSGRA